MGKWHDEVMGRVRRWTVFAVGGIATLGSAVAAVLFGVRGIEVASWLAALASFVVAVAALLLARAGGASVDRGSGLEPGLSVHSAGVRSIAVGGDIGGIASTGDSSTVGQHR
ncbi:hypothetical protein OG792_21230 [Micromonospora sp. NBC_01699]|uniref:hypothetical protein n=1 Tax=Micromonospora sp. NBC_01699 TaxID=2975984 RepID=UPI002E2E4D4B|nr:hypothetical protein [Micromonospora sp. NBC_01699]